MYVVLQSNVTTDPVMFLKILVYNNSTTPRHDGHIYCLFWGSTVCSYVVLPGARPRELECDVSVMVLRFDRGIREIQFRSREKKKQDSPKKGD